MQLSRIELSAFIGMNRALNKINRQTDALCTKYNLTRSQFGVLEALYHKGDLCIGEVQELILTTQGSIPVVVRNLLKKEYITRTSDPNDKRKFILSITDSGRELMDEVYPQNESIILDFFNIYTDEEKENLKNLMLKFKDAFL